MRFGVKSLIANGVLACLLLAGCVLALKFSDAPFGWIALAGFIACVSLCITIQHSALQNISLIAAFAMLPLAIIEFFLVWQYPAITWQVYEPSRSMYQLSDTLGYGPLKSAKVHATRWHNEVQIYDTSYSIDAQGLRITPASKNTESKKCLIFFGGSFTFGEGVADDETTANRVAEKTMDDYRIYNFGFPGYGPHQMLAALEKGLVKDIVGSCEQATAIYSGLTQHIGRAAGFSGWDVHGPRYALAKDGTAVFSGHFDEGQSLLTRQWHKQIIKSRIYQALFPSRLAGPYKQAEVGLYISIVTTARRLFKQQFGEHAMLDMVMWHPEFHERNMTAFKQIMTGLTRIDLVPYEIDEHVLAGTDPLRYIISIYDEHPNALAHEQVASYLVKTLALNSDQEQQSTQATVQSASGR